MLHTHDGHGCEHEGHSCGCLHSKDYDFECELPDELERWTNDTLTKMSSMLARLDLSRLTVEQIESEFEQWWRGESRGLRRAMVAMHARVCERGRGVIVNAVTGDWKRARCKSWRECEFCAWVYGRSVQRLWGQVKRIRAFAVFTMPRESADWNNPKHVAMQSKAIHRLAERLFRKFGHRFAMLWAREHNTDGEGDGRLHLNVLWDENWVDQSWLAETAAACGFGKVTWISRVGLGARLSSGEGRGKSAHQYATKVLRYATKDASTQVDWPKNTRRWGASRKARDQMKRPERNPDFYWSPLEPPLLRISPDARLRLDAADGESYWLLPESYLPTRAAPAVGQPRDGPSAPLQRTLPLDLEDDALRILKNH